ncbi:MAG: glycosyltransferase [Oryzomonas sp.]|uniref:glycosyltransferase family protein n=1 Tax=Oryzomonas sp. TaxID=2855186 RepID=UPI00284AA84B|nr:glycosyltransferase [Oryzomonas sp.]MDR3579543.1 glycosyltransferase [Oryzomonas sp.]
MNELNVWLAYVAHPITTAVYLERVLRRICRLTTIGPHVTEHLLEVGKFQNMKLPVLPHDIETSPTPDMAEILTTTPPEQHPDLYIWVHSVDGHFPHNLEALSCPKVCYLIDNHIFLAAQIQWAKNFDRVFIAQREYLPDFRAQGCNAYWLPLACDQEIHCKIDLPKLYPVSFVGGVPAGSRRERLFVQLGSQIPLYYERCFWDDMARVFSQSKIVLNEAVSNDLNMRVFEALSTGSLLLTDMARNSGQDILFNNGEDYALYRRDEELAEVARFYLENDALREQIAARGRRLVHNAHTYAHRVEDLLAVALGGKPDTFSAEELRERSLVDVSAIDAATHDAVCISSARRSFVIPVLDMSPASEYNVGTLLHDLEEVDGDVIVIFNGQEVAEQLKGHPRINRYAIMKQNIGVARAWNLGLEIAATPTVFIMNADLHVERAAIISLEQTLNSLPGAACVGPQGSFFDFSLTRDNIYFDKGSFNQPLAVDAVSGFFFAVKLEHFNAKLIRFENGFTPCYFEEWDLGLQIKRAGLKSYIVPTTTYDHHWSGTIRALREIPFYERTETAGEILLRNRLLFLNKWRGIADTDNNQELLVSGFKWYVINCAKEYMDNKNYDAACICLNQCPDDLEISAFRRFLEFQRNKLEYHEIQ